MAFHLNGAFELAAQQGSNNLLWLIDYVSTLLCFSVTLVKAFHHSDFVPSFFFCPCPLSSSSSSTGSKTQWIQSSAQPLSAVPQPRAERASHAAQRHLPGFFPAAQQPSVSSFSQQQLPQLSWKQQQHVPSLSDQLRPRKPLPDAR